MRLAALVAGSLLVLIGVGTTAWGLYQQAHVQQTVAARGQNDVNAVNGWLQGAASSAPSVAPSASSTPTDSPPTCGGVSSDADAYALVEFSGLSQYDYAGVAVNGNWGRLDDRSMVHWYGSPAPGQAGNVIIAFHREPDYQSIDQLAPGQTITVQDRSCHTYVYTVSRRWDLAPSAVNQLVPTSGHQLTLITCDPWWQDYNRLVWRASLTSVDGVPVATSG